MRDVSPGRRAVIVGVGHTEFSQNSGRSTLQLAAEASLAAIRDAVSASPVLIADGHHRYAISRTFRDEQRAAHGGDAGTAEGDFASAGAYAEKVVAATPDDRSARLALAVIARDDSMLWVSGPALPPEQN